MAGTVVIPWYATGFRAERFGKALDEIAAVAMRYGASSTLTGSGAYVRSTDAIT